MKINQMNNYNSKKNTILLTLVVLNLNLLENTTNQK